MIDFKSMRHISPLLLAVSILLVGCSDHDHNRDSDDHHSHAESDHNHDHGTEAVHMHDDGHHDGDDMGPTTETFYADEVSSGDEYSDGNEHHHAHEGDEDDHHSH